MTSPATPITVEQGAWPRRPYSVAPAQASTLSTPLPPRALCAFVQSGPAAAADPRHLQVPLLSLAGEGAGEIWLSESPVRYGWDGDLGYSSNEEILILQLGLEEARLAPLADAVYEAYRRISAFIAAQGYPHLWRVWHYLGGINEGEGDAERYRQFCLGRFRAMEHHLGFERQLPAASAIGSRGGGLQMIVVAGRQPGLQVENPRQVSAFRYPRVYGPRSPSFSRATLLPWSDGEQLLVSGTASIVGHATAHAGDTLAQLRQTAANLQALLAQGAQSLPPGQVFAAESYNVYLRREEELPLVLPELRRLFGDRPMQVLAGDICRDELLIEVEGMYRASGAGAA
jgi:chorismate lyase/3-hydroxybenzoate synthase